LDYDQENHRRLKQELLGLAEFESLAVRLKHAEEQLPADESNLRAVTELISAREKTIVASDLAVRELKDSLVELPSVVSALGVVTTSLQSLRAADREVTGKMANPGAVAGSVQTAPRAVGREADGPRTGEAGQGDLLGPGGRIRQEGGSGAHHRKCRPGDSGRGKPPARSHDGQRDAGEHRDCQGKEDGRSGGDVGNQDQR